MIFIYATHGWGTLVCELIIVASVFPQQSRKVYLRSSFAGRSVAGTVYRAISEAVHSNTTQSLDAARTNTIMYARVEC